MDNPAAANALGTLGAVCWSIQLLPQILFNAIRPSHTEGLQPSMMLLWASAGVPLGVYNIVSNFNIALRIQPQILTLLSLITWSQCRYYGRGWPVVKCLSWLTGIGVFMGAVELALIFALRAGLKESPHHYRVAWPKTFMAVLAAVLLALGVLRHYVDIYVHRTVRGISFIFVGIDAAGDLFSLISIFFQSHLDVLGMVIYGTELALWIGVFACGGWFNLLPFLKARISRRRRSEEGSQGRQGPQQPERVRQGAGISGIAMHDMPSSTSVFRTPSSGLVERVARDPQASDSAATGAT